MAKGKPDKEKAALDFSGIEDPDLLDALHGIIATHHPRLGGNSTVPPSQIIRDLTCLDYDHDWKHGVSSFSIDSPYGMGAVTDVKALAVGAALSCDLGREERDISLLGALKNRENRAPVDTIPAIAWSRLQEAYDRLESYAPREVTQFERLSFFESEGDEILITPVSSLKLVHEMNRRVRNRAAEDAKNKESGIEAPRRRPRTTTFRVGGSNPQNLGYAANNSSFRNTIRGAVTVFLMTPPEDRRSPEGRLLSVVGATKQYSRIAYVDIPTLLAYGRRGAIDIDLATHRAAERRQALDIARSYAKNRDKLVPLLRAIDDCQGREPWSSIAADELAWLAGGAGSLRLAAEFASDVKRRIEKLMSHGGDNPKTFILSDRSTAVLRDAFNEVLHP